MWIVLWILRLEALLIAVLVGAAVRSLFAATSGSWIHVALPTALPMAYALGLVIGLLRMRPEPTPPRRSWLAITPLVCQLMVYLLFWGMRGVGLSASTPGSELLLPLSILMFLFGYPMALPAGLVFRRARVLIVTEMLGPPFVILVLIVADLFP